MLESFKGNRLEYQKLSEEEQKSRGILGRLTGIIADSNNPTRNGRKYNKELWEKVFSNPLMEEKIRTRTCFGELGHPDYQEVNLEKVCVCLAEKPKVGDDGKLYGVFDILDTPNGRILKTLCDYQTSIGCSSRGSGELVPDPDGGEMVDPDSYDCECWDIVLTPAVESARLSYVKEDLGRDEKSSNLQLATALRESLDKASVDDRRVMESTLNELGIGFKEEPQILNESETPKQTKDSLTEAVSDGSQELIRSLQETLKVKAELEAKVQSLQEQLAVSNTKVTELEDECSKYKATTVRLSAISTSRKELAKKVSSLEEELQTKQSTIDSLNQAKAELEARKNKPSTSPALVESLKAKGKEVDSLTESIKAKDAQIKSLTEQLEQEKTESSKLLEETSSKLEKQSKLKESYKSLYISASDRYLASKATMLGIETEDITAKLPAKYSLDDIDRVCESLQDYARNISKLPFRVDRKVKARINESTAASPLASAKNDLMDDDSISDSLLRLGKLKQ